MEGGREEKVKAMRREGENIREGSPDYDTCIPNLPSLGVRVYSGGWSHLVVHTLPTSPPHSF